MPGGSGGGEASAPAAVKKGSSKSGKGWFGGKAKYGPKPVAKASKPNPKAAPSKGGKGIGSAAKAALQKAAAKAASKKKK